MRSAYTSTMAKAFWFSVSTTHLKFDEVAGPRLAVIADVVVAVEIGDDVALRSEQRNDALAVPHAVFAGGINGIVVHDNDLLAGGSRLGDLIAEPGELSVAQRAIPAMGIRCTFLLQFRQHLGSQNAVRMVFGRREDADVVAVEHDEAPACREKL